MLEIPFSSPFIEKLAVYQQIIDYSSRDSKKCLWEGEKALLLWTRTGHWHLDSSINVQSSMEIIVKHATALRKNENTKDTKEYKQACQAIKDIEHVIGNLKQNGLVEVDYQDRRADTLKFTQRGLAWGKVLHDIKKGQEHKYKLYTRLIDIALPAAIIGFIIGPILTAVTLYLMVKGLQ